MFTPLQKERMLECARAAARWFFRNQNTNENPWGGMMMSADEGRFVYEYFPVEKHGRGAGVWAQALAIMALHSVNLRDGKRGFDYAKRDRSARLAAKYLCSLQYDTPHRPACHGGFAENVPFEPMSYPRDAATGAMGLCALHRLTGEQEYLDRAVRFAEWYKNHGCDETGYPYISFDFNKGEHSDDLIQAPGEEEVYDNVVNGNWQAGGSLAYYYLASQTGDRKYIDDYMMPMIEGLLKIYADNPYDGKIDGFHCEHPVIYGNDDFAIVALLCAYVATGRKDIYDVAHERVMMFKKYWDAEHGRFPTFAGSFVAGITMKVLCDLDVSEGRTPDNEIMSMIAKVAESCFTLQAFDYNEPRINGGFWGQSTWSVAKGNWIHQRSTGYAAIFYSMLSGDENVVPYYNCLGWEIPK